MAKMTQEDCYRTALKTWREVHNGHPSHVPLRQAFGLDPNDLADPCDICGRQESVYEHSYDAKETRMIPSGFPPHEQVPHEKLCFTCASERFTVTPVLPDPVAN